MQFGQIGPSQPWDGIGPPRSGIAHGDGMPSGGDVPRSPWPSQGVVQDLGRLYRLRRGVVRYPYGSAKTYSMPPGVVYFGRSPMAPTKPSAAVASRGSSRPDTTEPDHPPTPERMATYCLPSGPR